MPTLTAQEPDVMYEGLVFVGDTKRFTVCGDEDGLVGPLLDGVEWENVTAATLRITPPYSDDAITVVGTASGDLWYADYLIPDDPGTWDAYWTITDGTTTQTVGSFQFEVRKIRGT